MANVSKEYYIEIDPRILELLGPNLYTNIYYVLAELIANAYDADAKNVYVIAKPDEIVVEDDGTGMSYYEKDINRYLNVAAESRTTKENSITANLSRIKMGRKGVGKLAALSVSENVFVKTIKDGDKSGFILSRHVEPDKKLISLDDEEIVFDIITEHGTSVVMTKPQYRLPLSLKTLRNNILKVFPLIDKDFRIHLIRNQEEIIIDNFEEEIISELSNIITLGDDFEHLLLFFKTDYTDSLAKLAENRKAKEIPVIMEDQNEEKAEYNMVIRGWIGTYITTRGRKKTITDFPDNFISLYANKKLGEFNILPYVGQNKLPEVYVVGQLHIDLFEVTELPDMALSNRQGYKTEDSRHKLATKYVRDELLPDILKMRDAYVSLKKGANDNQKWDTKKYREEQFKKDVEKFKDETSSMVAEKLSKERNLNYENIKKIVFEEINTRSPQLGLKPVIDNDKKRILISHTKKDKDLADIVYNMLLFNGVPARDILYTNCDEEAARIPEGKNIYDYLRDFFVNSYSAEKIYTIYITSKEMGESWGAVAEVGAGWITQINHKIFNIGVFRPEHPLDDSIQWQVTKRHEGSIYTDTVNFDIFCAKIESVCSELGYPHRARSDNMTKLDSYLIVLKYGEFISL
jgi:hypothetical protein